MARAPRGSLTIEPLARVGQQLVGLAVPFPYGVRHRRTHIPVRPPAHHDIAQLLELLDRRHALREYVRPILDARNVIEPDDSTS